MKEGRVWKGELLKKLEELCKRAGSFSELKRELTKEEVKKNFPNLTPRAVEEAARKYPEFIKHFKKPGQEYHDLLAGLCHQAKNEDEFWQLVKEKFSRKRRDSIQRTLKSHPDWTKHWEQKTLSEKASSDPEKKEKKIESTSEVQKIEWSDEEILKFLQDFRTGAEIAKHFSFDLDEVEDRLKKKKTIGNYELISYRKQNGAFVYCYREKLEITNIQSKIFTTKISPDDDSCLMIKFPNDLDWREIRIIPLAESMYGSSQCDEERFRRYLNHIRRSPYAFAILNGGLIALPGRVSMNEKVVYIFQQIENFSRELTPIAHKIIWAHQGCTEAKLERDFGIDPLEEVCLNLGIIYLKRPVNAWLQWKKKVFKFHCIHGVTRAKKRGSLINPLIQILESLPFVDFLIMSHQGSGKSTVVPRFIRDYKRLRLKELRQHLIITPSFTKYEGSKAERMGDPIPIQGSLACILYAEGYSGVSE